LLAPLIKEVAAIDLLVQQLQIATRSLSRHLVSASVKVLDLYRSLNLRRRTSTRQRRSLKSPVFMRLRIERLGLNIDGDVVLNTENVIVLLLILKYL
jgi:hypothetical protein